VIQPGSSKATCWCWIYSSKGPAPALRRDEPRRRQREQRGEHTVYSPPKLVENHPTVTIDLEGREIDPSEKGNS